MQSDASTAVPAEQPATPRVCKGSDCTKQLQSNNKSGYCELHEHIGRRRPQKPKLCAYSACGLEFVPTKGHQNYCKPECRQKARNALALEKYHKKRRLLEKQREEAVQIALQAVHECEKCREVLDQLFRSTPSAIERYHKDVKAATANASTSVQSKKRCECCGLLPVVGTHGNCKLCIPCGVVRADESQRENSRRHRGKLRGEAPVEEVMLCIDCGKEVEPNPRTGKIDLRRLRCLKCTEAHERDLKNEWKKNKSAEARAKAGQVCRGLKIVDEWIRQCGLRWVPAKSMKQEFCSTQCGSRTQSILYRLDPKTATYYKDNATKTRKLAKIALQLEPKLAEAEAAKAEVERLAQRLAWRPERFGAWPAEDQMIGLMLIENPTLSNREIGQRLDDKSRLKCPFGGTWERSLTTPGTGANRMSFIRAALQNRPAA